MRTSQQKILSDANLIAVTIQETDTDDRGLLFLEVAKILSKKYDQFYTFSLFKQIAEEYGYPQQFE